MEIGRAATGAGDGPFRIGSGSSATRDPAAPVRAAGIGSCGIQGGMRTVHALRHRTPADTLTQVSYVNQVSRRGQFQ